MKQYVFNRNSCLDLNTTSCIKGILALMVLICHLHARVDVFATSLLGTIFSAFGYLAVSVFFFLSGYGLSEVASKKENYIPEFPLKKLFPFFCLSSFTILIYLSRDLIVGNDIHFLEVLQSFLIGDTIVDNGWYLQVQMLFYILFYLTYRFGKTKKNIFLIVLVIIYCILGYFFDMATTWYEASLCFPLGAIYSAAKEKIKKTFILRNLWFFVSIGILSLTFVIALLFGNKNILPEELRIIVKMISSILFSLLFALFFSKFNINFFFTRFLGKYSLEIYLTQGIFLSLFVEQIPIKNDWLYMLATAFSTIIFSIIVHPIFNFITKIGNKMKRKIKP